MKRGWYICLIIILFVLSTTSAFSLTSIGGERNFTSQTIGLSSQSSIHCLQFQTMSEQIQCRLVAIHLLPIQSIFCADTVEVQWCQKLLTDAETCFEYEGLQKDACFIDKAQSYSVLEYTSKDSYTFLLLLDLIQGVEDAYDQDDITIRHASILITKVVIIAQAKMRHEPTSVITTLLKDYTYFWELYTTKPTI